MTNKILTICVLVIIGVIVAFGFLTASTYVELAIASLFYPPLAYFIFKSFPSKSKKSPQSQPVASVATQVGQPAEEVENNFDSDKRAFLKLIGTAGFSYFLFHIFGKKPDTPFFNTKTPDSGTKTLQDVAGNNIDPAERQPIDGYQITEIDEGATIYTGFANKNKAWYIMRGDTTTGSFRYAKGDSNFPANWDNRQQLKYDYFYNVFS